VIIFFSIGRVYICIVCALFIHQSVFTIHIAIGRCSCHKTKNYDVFTRSVRHSWHDSGSDNDMSPTVLTICSLISQTLTVKVRPHCVSVNYINLLRRLVCACLCMFYVRASGTISFEYKVKMNASL